MEPNQRESHLQAIETDGYTILEDVLPLAQVEKLRERVREIERETLRPLESGESEEDSSFFRTAGLLRLDPIFWDVPIQPLVLDLLEGVLGHDFLISTYSGIDLKPAQNTVQPLHPDDALIPVGRPHERPIGCTCMFVLTEFNSHTGGTRLLPGSHRAPLDLLFSQDEETLARVIQPELRPGSVLMFDHALFHGAADNHSDDWRLGLQISYHAGWIRPYTNWFRSIPVEEVSRFPQKLADLLGYKTFNGIGTVNATPGSYRESYTGKRAPRDPRLSLAR